MYQSDFSQIRDIQNHTKDPVQFKHRHHPIIWSLVVLSLVGSESGLFMMHHMYHHANAMFQNTYQAPRQMPKLRDVSKLIQEKKPVSVLLLGTDTGALGRNDKGRTDTMILATLNPQKHTTFLTSIPRDTKVQIPKDPQSPDKINNAYTIGGPAQAADSVQKLLNVPVDYYAVINMGGLEKMVNAVDGVTVNPPLSFKYGATNVKKNHKVTLKNRAALDYARMRHQDPRGDFGRQLRQRQILQNLVMRGLKITSLPRYKSILGSLKGNLKTNIRFDDMMAIRTKYRLATHHIVSISLDENSQTQNGIDYEVPDKVELQKVSKAIRKSLGLDDHSVIVNNNSVGD